MSGLRLGWAQVEPPRIRGNIEKGGLLPPFLISVPCVALSESGPRVVALRSDSRPGRR